MHDRGTLLSAHISFKKVGTFVSGTEDGKIRPENELTRE